MSVNSSASIPDWLHFLRENFSHFNPRKKDVVVIVHSVSDHNGAISQQAISRIYSDLDKTHHVVLEFIKHHSDILAAIEKGASFGLPIDSLVITSHGYSKGMKFGLGEEMSNWYHSADLNPATFSKLPANASIFLLACLTANGFAQHLADAAAPRTVIASTDLLNVPLLWDSFCDTHGCREWYCLSKANSQMLRVFQKGVAPREPCPEGDLREWSRVDQTARLMLAHLYLNANSASFALPLCIQFAENIGSDEDDDEPASLMGISAFSVARVLEKNGRLDLAERVHRMLAETEGFQSSLEWIAARSKRQAEIRQIA